MINAKAAFSGFSVDDAAKAKTFYTETLGLKLAGEEMRLDLELPGGGKIFVYEKADHQPATFTILNFVVDNIDEAVDQLTTAGVVFEQYDNEYIKTDEKGIARPSSPDQGPNIAWFKDPAGNILSVLEG
jgi:catechol 2,3-dioxygenase-like lactoylglutathione lyase family enzyme